MPLRYIVIALLVISIVISIVRDLPPMRDCHEAAALIQWWALTLVTKTKLAFSVPDVRENKCQNYSSSLEGD